MLDAALEVFVARGYHAAAMDEIADRAGVSKPVLYQHFPGKQELYLALLDESVDRLIEAVEAALRSTADNRQRVNATFAAYYEYIAEHTGTFRLVFESDLTSEPAVRERLEAADRALRRPDQPGDQGGRRPRRRRGSPALHRAARHGPGERQVLAQHGRLHPQGGRRAARRPAGLARHQRLAAQPTEPSRKRRDMDVKIGIQSIPRELVFESDATAEEVERDLTAALAAKDGKGIFALSTSKSGRVLIPAEKIAYVEFSTDQARRVGFGNIV